MVLWGLLFHSREVVAHIHRNQCNDQQYSAKTTRAASFELRLEIQYQYNRGKLPGLFTRAMYKELTDIAGLDRHNQLRWHERPGKPVYHTLCFARASFNPRGLCPLQPTDQRHRNRC